MSAIDNTAEVTPMPPMTINWVGLWTMIRRELSRLMRVPTQAFIAPWISALMFIFVFGYIVGGRIATIGGHRYIEFVLPGILMINVINAAFLQSSSQIYFQRFLRYIEEALVAPFSYVEMIVGLLAMTVVRAVITAIGILLIGAAFGATSVTGILEFLFWIVSVSVIFGLLGIIIGLWANNFEQLTMLNIFFITPLSFVGGVFNTVHMLPEWMRWIAWANPFFYFINGIRHSMIGFSEAPELLGAGFTVTLAVILAVVVWKLFSVGYGLRE
ncbi:MAG TPA: ABC transporter permease [Rhizomicrobium sp.]|jgi:ABC-2 type transport system permease protein|nr:ABC transporter permease [Rhizomicrobium sp.]